MERKIKERHINCYSLHPGVFSSGFITKATSHSAFFSAVFTVMMDFVLAPFLKTIEQAAQTTIYCAIAESLIDQSGRYYSDCKERWPGRDGEDDEVAEKLWDLSLKLVELPSN